MKFLPIGAVAVLAILAGCSSDSSTQIVPSQDQQSESSLISNPFQTSPADDETDGFNGAGDESAQNSFKGEIGFIIDARKIRSQGYTPRSAMITVVDQIDSVDSPYEKRIEQQVALGVHSFMGVFKLSVAELEQEVLTALDNGADVFISLYETIDLDGADPIVEDYQVTRVVLQANPKPIIISGDAVEPRNVQFTLSPDTEYFIQHVNWMGQTTGYGLTFQTPAGRNVFVHKDGIPVDNAQAPSSDKWLYRFYPIPGETNTFAIQYKDTNQFLRVAHNFFHLNAGHETWSRGGRHNALRLASETELDSALSQHGDWARFEIKKVTDGVFTLHSKKTGEALRRVQGDAQNGDGHYWGLSFGSNDSTEPDHFHYQSYKKVWGQWDPRGNHGSIPLSNFYFRIVTNNVDWELESIGSEMVQTVMPTPRVGIAYETDEDNCGSTVLTTTTGIDRSAETSLGAEFQESFSLMTSKTDTLGWKIGVSVGGSPGPSFSAEVSGEHTWHSENSQTTTETSVQTSTETISFSSTKEVKVQPGHNSRVQAAYEVYDDIKAQFVQRFQIRGVDKKTGIYLSGEEIATQLQFTSFGGVVSGTGFDVAEFTLHGEATVSNLIKGRTTITERPISCD